MSVQDETKGTVTRRGLAQGGLAIGGMALVGMTLAAQQALAATEAQLAAAPPGPKPTGDDGLVVGDVTFKGFDQTIGGYRAYPKGSPKGLPVIICLPMIKGVNFPPHRDMVRRLAREGFYVIMPDLWIRKGDANAVPFPQLVSTLVAEPNLAEQQLDIDAAIAFAGTEGANTKKLGMFGYDNGGRVIYRYLSMNPKVVAGVAYSAPTEATPLSIPGKTEAKPTPIELAGGMKGRILAIYGDQEGTIKPADIENMKAALAKAGDTKSKVSIYPGKHGFITNFDSTEDSKKAWAEGVAWLKSHGLKA